MNTSWMKTRQTKYGSYAAVYIIVVVAVLVMANFLANRYSKSYDSTANKRFSLSDQTEKVVRNLKQDVRINYFDKPEGFNRGRDLLGRYESLSPKLKVDYIDLDKRSQLAASLGVRSAGTAIVEVGNKHEEAKMLTEEEVTSALIRGLKTSDKSVCFTTGAGENGVNESDPESAAEFKAGVERSNYKTQVLNLVSKAEIPKECTVVIVGGPRADMLAPSVNALKAYVEGGGRALFMLDPPLKIGKEQIADNEALVAMLAGWGVTLEKDMVLDTSGMGQLFQLGPEAPLATTYETHPIVKEMRQIASVFPLPRSILVKSTDKVNPEKLFDTSEQSFGITNLSSADVRIDEKRDKKGPFALGAAGTYKNGQPNNEGRFVVVGSSRWLTRGLFRSRAVGNHDLALNMLNWLSSDEDLISIRPKDPEDRRISLTGRQINMVLLFSVFLLPLLIVIAGVSVWWRRR